MEVKLQKAEWEGISAEDRKKIQEIIASHFGEQVSVIPEASFAAAKELIATRRLAAFNLSNPICTSACGIAEAAAVAACSSLAPLLIPICVAAAHAAGDFCRAQCK
jgi:hypothetical protein